MTSATQLGSPPVGVGTQRWQLLGLLLLVAAVGGQVWPWLAAPLLPFEDGALLFATHYAGFDLAACCDSYAGYVAFGGNLLAALCCRLPVGWIPSAFVVAASLSSVAAASSLLHPAWRRLLPPAVQLTGALVMVLPLGSYLMLGSLAYAQWTLLWWLALIMLHPERRVGAARAGEAALVIALAWSHPLAGLLLPLAIVVELRRVDGGRWLWLAAAVIAYWGLVWSREGLAVQPAAGGRFAVAAELLLVRGALEALLGESGRVWLGSNLGVWAEWAAGLVIVSLLGAVLWRSLRQAEVALRVRVTGLLVFAVLVVVLSACSRSAAGGGAGWVVRYVWVLRVAVLLVPCLAVARWARGTRRGALLVAIVLLLGAWLWRSNRDYFSHADGAQYVRMLTDELAAQERRLGGRAEVEAVLPRVQASIIVRPR